MSDIRVSAAIDADVAFEVYLQKAGRSLLKTNEITGVPIGTLRTWSNRHNWKDRADALEYQARRANHHHILSILDAEMPATLRNLKHLKENATSEKVQLDANKLWFELWSKYRTLTDDEQLADEDDVSSLPDADLFATLKREAQR